METATRPPEITVGPPRAESGNSRRDIWRLVLVLVALTIALRLPAFFVDVFNSDETFLATQAQVIRDGGDLYRDATDRKPPLVPYIYAATFDVFDTSSLWTVRVMAMAAVVLTALMLAAEARRRYGNRAAWIAGVLCVLASVAFAPQDGQAANFEIFMLPAMTAAVLLARRDRPASAGVAVAIATLAKQTGAATLLPVLYVVWRARRGEGVIRALLGFAIPLGLVAAALGPRRMLHWTVLGNGSYVDSGSLTTTVPLMFLLMTLAWVGCNLPIVWRLPFAWRERRVRSDDGETDTDLWIWLAAAALSVMVGLRFFGHYYLQLLAPAVLLTAGSLARTTPKLMKSTVAFAAVLALAFSAAGYFMKPGGPAPKYKTVSQFLVTHTTDSDRIFVWGSVPEIYWAAERLPATRFVTTLTFLAGNHPGREGADAAPENSRPEDWDHLFEDLGAHPPAYILDTAPAHIRGAEWTPIERFPRLEAFVQGGYRYIGSIDDIAIYERK